MCDAYLIKNIGIFATRVSYNQVRFAYLRVYLFYNAFNEGLLVNASALNIQCVANLLNTFLVYIVENRRKRHNYKGISSGFTHDSLYSTFRFCKINPCVAAVRTLAAD